MSADAAGTALGYEVERALWATAAALLTLFSFLQTLVLCTTEKRVPAVKRVTIPCCLLASISLAVRAIDPQPAFGVLSPEVVNYLHDFVTALVIDGLGAYVIAIHSGVHLQLGSAAPRLLNRAVIFLCVWLHLAMLVFGTLLFTTGRMLYYGIVAINFMLVLISLVLTNAVFSSRFRAAALKALVTRMPSRRTLASHPTNSSAVPSATLEGKTGRAVKLAFVESRSHAAGAGAAPILVHSPVSPAGESSRLPGAPAISPGGADGGEGRRLQNASSGAVSPVPPPAASTAVVQQSWEKRTQVIRAALARLRRFNIVLNVLVLGTLVVVSTWVLDYVILDQEAIMEAPAASPYDIMVFTPVWVQPIALFVQLSYSWLPLRDLSSPSLRSCRYCCGPSRYRARLRNESGEPASRHRSHQEKASRNPGAAPSSRYHLQIEVEAVESGRPHT